MIGYTFKLLLHHCDVYDTCSDKCKLLSFTVQKTSFKQIWFAKCLAEEGSVYTLRIMVSASLLDSINLIGPYRADVVTCKPYNQRTEQISYFIDHFNKQLKNRLMKIVRSVHSLTAGKG